MINIKTYIKGKYRSSIFTSPEGYTIGLFKVLDTNDELLEHYLNKTITFTGYFPELNETDTYILYGKLVTHPKYGEQFQTDEFERAKLEEKDAIIEFLSSGLFKGIGEAKAKKIVSVLGKDTLKIILENPNDLILIPGITDTNIKTLNTKLKEYSESYEIIMHLTTLGFSTKESMLIYNYYKEKTMDIINTNIYQIIRDINNITFKKIDHIALNNGVEQDSLIRVSSAIIYVMNELSNTYGHSYYYREDIFMYLSRVLGIIINEELFNEAVDKLQLDLELIIKDDKYYLREMYESESLIVKRIRLLSKEKETIKNIDKYLETLQKVNNITYNDKQKEAIKNSLLNNFLIITGGPGTGKTTIIKGIIDLYQDVSKCRYEDMLTDLVLLAPTGRAAKRMSEVTMYPASTIHRFLKWQKETNHFQINDYNKSKAKFVILDEASMVDTYLMANLLRGLSIKTKLIIVGDYHQLPSVGPGQVLADLIDSKMLPVIELNELYRQGKDSNILSLAYNTKDGIVDENIFNVGEDLTFINSDSIDVINNIIDITNTYSDLSYKDYQILCPMYKTIVGIDEINKRLQKEFNPKSAKKKEVSVGEDIYREGDKVIQLTNMPDDNVYNGDIGLITEIKTMPKKEIVIDFDGNIVRYTPSNFNNFKLAYAISIHKSQGSEFNVVVMPLVNNYRKMLYRRLVYTGITRAKKKLYLIGDLNSLRIAANNTTPDIRRTTIKDFLIDGIN